MLKFIYFIAITFSALIACNKAFITSRIVNGKVANISDFTFQLSLRYKTIHICGASILADIWAITASHCVYDAVSTPREITLRMGSKWRTKEGVVVPVITIYSHPNYNPETLNFDVSLLKMRKNTFKRLDLSLAPIRLPLLASEINDNTAATISGWGHQSASEHNLSNELMCATVNTVNHQKCQENLATYGEITNAMFCAAARNTDACQGDSGGPIQVDGILVGVVSWGVGCADPYYPGIYTRLSYPPIRLWIKLLTKL